MLDNKDYISRLNKARRKRNRRFDPTYLLIGLAVILVLALLIGGGVFLSRRLRPVLSGEGQARDEKETETVMQTETEAPTLSEEEIEAQELEPAIDGVLAS